MPWHPQIPAVRFSTCGDERLAAAAFLLNGAEVLWFWCAVSGLDPRIVRRYARQLFDHPQEFELLSTQAASS